LLLCKTLRLSVFNKELFDWWNVEKLPACRDGTWTMSMSVCQVGLRYFSHFTHYTSDDLLCTIFVMISDKLFLTIILDTVVMVRREQLWIIW